MASSTENPEKHKKKKKHKEPLYTVCDTLTGCREMHGWMRLFQDENATNDANRPGALAGHRLTRSGASSTTNTVTKVTAVFATVEYYYLADIHNLVSTLQALLTAP